MFRLILLTTFFTFMWRDQAYALAPIESLVLGNFTESYSENSTDPLNYVFGRDKQLQSTDKTFKRELALYRGFYEEGKNTVNYCKNIHSIHYATEWEKIQVMRSLFSEIQYIGLDLTTRAIPQYAKALEFTKQEYESLVDNLVGNYCSSNLSVISKKELKNNFLVKFDKENTFRLPSVEGNPFFPDNMETYVPKKTAIEQEFKYTVKLFQSICSWGGDPTNPALMTPILKHPALMAFFIRQMDNQVIDWKERDNSVFIKQDKNTIQVLCDNLICRKTFADNFYNRFFYSVGGTNVSEDLKRLYCEELRTLDPKTNNLDERLVKMINSRTFDEENFINSQFIALITGVPDFFLGVDKFKKGEDLFRSSIDYTWNKWAKSQIENSQKEIYFEEPLALELVDRSLYFNKSKPKFMVSFDVSLGEFDRINQRTGKVRLDFDIKVQKSFMIYYREALKSLEQNNFKEKAYLEKKLKMQITKDVQGAREKLLIPPWKGDLEALIAREISEEIISVSDADYKLTDSNGWVPIRIELNYGLFALKYLNHQKTVQSSRTKSDQKSNETK